jgi:hypothetical protein
MKGEHYADSHMANICRLFPRGLRGWDRVVSRKFGGRVSLKGNFDTLKSVFLRYKAKHAADAGGFPRNDPKPGNKQAIADAPPVPKSQLPVFSLLFAFGEII